MSTSCRVHRRHLNPISYPPQHWWYLSWFASISSAYQPRENVPALEGRNDVADHRQDDPRNVLQYGDKSFPERWVDTLQAATNTQFSVQFIVIINMLRAHQKHPKTEGTSEETTATHDTYADGCMTSICLRWIVGLRNCRRREPTNAASYLLCPTRLQSPSTSISSCRPWIVACPVRYDDAVDERCTVYAMACGIAQKIAPARMRKPQVSLVHK